AAGFGAPVSLREHLGAGGTVEALGERLMAAIAAVVPVLPVPLVARALGEGAASREELAARVQEMIARLTEAGAVLKLPPVGGASVLDEGLEPLIRRGLVSADLKPVPKERALLQFYAASVPEIDVSAPPQT
ncbi:MAG TPA: glycerol-3-phosphate acyltransferase, partial [Tabrizicola sp.]|nr:glycerol-3-phosphate acyltransferase [Tabrizicola sp.]